MQAGAAGMAARGYGRVINIASVHGLVASVDKAPYVGVEIRARRAQPGGGAGICRGRRPRLGRRDGQLHLPRLDRDRDHRAAGRGARGRFGGDRDAGIASLLAEKQPSRRLSDPSEIGKLALWLCAPHAHNVTGTAIPVDGGWTAQ
jgi:3-hydroxybutyrate dehydrogenase